MVSSAASKHTTQYSPGISVLPFLLSTHSAALQLPAYLVGVQLRQRHGLLGQLALHCLQQGGMRRQP